MLDGIGELASLVARAGPMGIPLIGLLAFYSVYSEIDRSAAEAGVLVWSMTVFMVISGGCFCTKLLINWPKFPLIEDGN